MKSFTYFLLIFASLSVGCEKDTGDGRINFKVTYQGQPVPSATIFIKAGSLADPNIPDSIYDIKLTADSRGKYKYNDVEPGKYFIYVKGEVQNTQVTGSQGLQVRQRFRLNTYDVDIDLH